jgi:Asp-tRNA(Asn)/Glu-tRNA(Gln) amidotransferase A subunit family amidase
VEEVSLPLAEHATTLIMLTSDADIAAYFLHRWLRERWDDFDIGTRRRLAVGCLVPAVVYSRAMRGRVLVRAEVLDRLRTYDALLSPTNPVPPPRIDASPGRIDASTDMGKARRLCTYPFAVANTPTISVPSGFSDAGLPLALQIAGRPSSASPTRTSRRIPGTGGIPISRSPRAHSRRARSNFPRRRSRLGPAPAARIPGSRPRTSSKWRQGSA